MSVTTADFDAPAQASPSDAGIARALGRAADWIRRRHSIHMHRRILHSLPDHVLDDIGISRSAIHGIVPERLDHAGRPNGAYPF